MAVVQNTYTGDGTTVLYSLSFPYLDEADVKVSVNGTVVTNYIFSTASSIQFLTAPGAGTSIRIYRETDIDDQAATIFPGSAIKAQDLNENFTQTLYAVQESNFEADSATTTANTALTNSNTAISTANSAVSTANTALSTANAAVVTANTAESNSLAAVSTANTASSNASAAVSTANAASAAAASAVSTANSAVSTANSAVSTANSAVSTANTALSNSNTAISTANAADANATAAVATANAADANATAAVSTANSAASTANTALSNSATAISTANAAAAAVASAVLYAPVADLAALALLTPADGDYFELQDSTGAESDPSITGVPVGLVGDAGLSFRLRYDDPPQEYVFLEYFATDSETRYLKLTGGTLTGQLLGDNSTSPTTPGFAFDGDANTGVGTTGADELALVTGGSIRVSIDPAGGVTVNDGLDVASNVITSVADPTSAQDAATKNYVDTAIGAISQNSISQNNSNVTVTDDNVSDGEVRVTVDSNTAIFFATNGTNAYTPTFHQNTLGLANQNDLKFFELASNGNNYLGFKAPASLAGDVTWTLPAADGSNNEVLATNGSGALSWRSISGSSITQGDSSVQVIDTGTGYVSITADGNEIARFDSTNGINALKELFTTNNIRIVANPTSGLGELRFAEQSTNGNNYVSFKPPASIAADVTWTLPAADATVAGHALKSDAAGNLSWGTAGGATGGGTDDVFYENAQTVTTNYTLTTNKNAMSAGPITVNSGVTVTIPSGQSWVIV